MSWTTILLVGGIVVAATILLAGQTLTPDVSIDEGGVTVTPINTNTSGQGTP